LAEKFYGTGRRKEAVARVWIAPGAGSMRINGMPAADYVHRVCLEKMVKGPLEAAGLIGQLDVTAKVTGGGVSGQAGAVRHGIARALVAYRPELRDVLRRGGFLTRDPRVKERKKYGRKRARRGFQFKKR
jgi:small subunit ribosomal protein S9